MWMCKVVSSYLKIQLNWQQVGRDAVLVDMRAVPEEIAAQQFAAHYEIKVMPSVIRP